MQIVVVVMQVYYPCTASTDQLFPHFLLYHGHAVTDKRQETEAKNSTKILNITKTIQ